MHPLHASNMVSHLLEKEKQSRDAGFRTSEVQVVPRWTEVAALADKVKKDRVEQQKN